MKENKNQKRKKKRGKSEYEKTKLITHKKEEKSNWKVLDRYQNWKCASWAGQVYAAGSGGAHLVASW